MANSKWGGLILFGVEVATGRLVSISKPNAIFDDILKAARLVRPPEPLTTTEPQILCWAGKTLLPLGYHLIKALFINVLLKVLSCGEARIPFKCQSSKSKGSSIPMDYCNGKVEFGLNMRLFLSVRFSRMLWLMSGMLEMSVDIFGKSDS